MPESFGARLRQHREQRAVSLRTIADQTKIKLSLLEGLERDDIAHWPCGIYRRAYVRAYAQAIGLEPDAVAREFFAIHPEPVEIPAPAPEAPAGLRGLIASALQPLSRRRGSEAAAQGQLPSAGQPTDAAAAPAPAPSETDIDLLAAAQLCTELGRVEHSAQLLPLLRQAATILDARGVIVWVWDALSAELRPALVHGYSSNVLSRLPAVKRDANNVTAEAFRSAETCAIEGNGKVSGALVVPLLTPAACAGVLAIELRHGSAHAAPVRAVAIFLAAMLAQLISTPPVERSP